MIRYITILLAAAFLCASCAPPADALLIEGQKAYQIQDYHTAFTKLLAAARENVNAQYAVGYMYYNGIGTKQNSAKALMWFRKAADFNQPQAIKALHLIEQGALKSLQAPAVH